MVPPQIVGTRKLKDHKDDSSPINILSGKPDMFDVQFSGKKNGGSRQ
jgi:hypothetical protein